MSEKVLKKLGQGNNVRQNKYQGHGDGTGNIVTSGALAEMVTDQGGTEGLLNVVSASAEIYSHNKGNVGGEESECTPKLYGGQGLGSGGF